MKKIVVLATLLLSLSPLACKKAADEHPRGSAPQAAAAGHGEQGARPGSHEDWCGEHGVPESQCTRCHPELAAAFKATGDWCAEHGLPKSHDTRCNPSLKIQRPPKGS